jgi:hypothetical protein
MIHYYENIGENWFSYAAFYQDMIDKIPDCGIVVELGCWKGRSSSCLGVEIINSGKEIELFCVDSWYFTPDTEQPVSSQEEFDKVYSEFLQNTLPIKDVLKIIRNPSFEAVKLFQDNSIDFMFIDASHYYKDVKLDNKLWLPKIKEGGIIAGHDYFTSVHPGVKQAVDECFPDVETIPEQNVWFYKK